MSTLRHIKVRNYPPDLKNFPNFLILGPQRTGTTWLYFNLTLHPEISMNRLKETYYFNTLGEPDHSHFRYPYLEDYLASFQETFVEKIKKQYVSLRKSFRYYNPKTIGEATASYATIPEEVISEIVQLKPDVKGIIMLRHPIDRAWSHAKKTAVRDKPPGTVVNLPILRSFFESQGQRQRADYPTMIDTWKRNLAPGNLYLGLYDRIITEPKELLNDIERFLGVTTNALFLNRHLVTRVNPTPHLDMPPDIKEFLEDFFRKDCETYNELVASLRAKQT
ncbi:MAG: sulfotransferase domain-containing protein [Chthoniobacterales bacterium]